MPKLTIALQICLLILISMDSTKGMILNVPSDTYPTIQAAIDAAVDGDEIVVADGTYTGEGNRDIDFLGKVITVRSENGPDSCVIDCENSGRGFYFHTEEDGDSVLEAFTITKANGSAVYCDSSSPTIIGCIFTANSSSEGGGMHCRESSPIVSDCLFIWNTAPGSFGHGSGAGMYNLNSNPTVANCLFADNWAETGGGGGMRNIGGNPTIENCTFYSNRAYFYCGGMRNNSSNVTIRNCTFEQNRSAHGGAILNIGSTTMIVNCLLAWNGEGAYYGESIGVGLSSTTALVNCTLVGGDVDVWRNSSLTAMNCIFQSMLITDMDLGDNQIVIGYSCVQGGWTGTGNIDADPMFTDYSNGDYHLLPESPCIDTGDDSAVPDWVTMDLDGNRRIQGIHVDMGAFEALASDPIELAEDLVGQVAELNIQSGISNSLNAKLDAVSKALNDINDNNDVAAINALEAFINAVEVQRGNKISEEDADILIAIAQQIINLLIAE